MTTPVYVFICTRTTADVVVPRWARTQEEYNRRVSGGFSALAGGFLRAGDLVLRPTQDAIPNHLLCDGSVLQAASFPELADYLGGTFGGDGLDTFGLPDYGNDIIAVPALTVQQVVSPSGTVSSGGDVVIPDSPGQTGGSSGGDVGSGGRPRRITGKEQQP